MQLYYMQNQIISYGNLYLPIFTKNTSEIIKTLAYKKHTEKLKKE